MPDLARKLKAGLRALGEDADSHPCEVYLAYLELLKKWNRAYNLSGIRDPERMLAYHLLDSLSLLPFLRGERCLDVGTGAGLPGLILALARPAIRWVLLDSVGKKIRFLKRAVTDLGIKNADIVQSRVEDYRADRPFTTIVSRAFGPLSEFCEKGGPLLAPRGVLLAMKGAKPGAEFPVLEGRGMKITVHRVRVPGVESGRNIVCIEVPPRT